MGTFLRAGNAIKFTPAPGVDHGEVLVTISSEGTAGDGQEIRLKFSIKDTGELFCILSFVLSELVSKVPPLQSAWLHTLSVDGFPRLLSHRRSTSSPSFLRSLSRASVSLNVTA